MSKRERETREISETREKISYVVRSFIPYLLLLSFCLSTSAVAQRRPKLIPIQRDYFAGKILLVPRDERPPSLDQPRMIALIADHDLITPPSSIIGDAEKLNAWASTINFDETDGAIVSLDVTAGSSLQGRLNLIKQIRAARPAIPIYGFTTFSGPSNQSYQSVIDLVAERALDFLLISSENSSNNSGKGQQKDLLTRLKNGTSSRGLGKWGAFGDGPDSAVNSLLARMINIRFGFTPRVLPVYSSSVVREAIASGRGSPIQGLINDKVRLLNGAEPPQTSDGAKNVDVLLFVHTPQTQDQERVAVAETIAKTIDRNVRIALVDLSESKESKDGMIAELRSRKLLDKLAAYASFDPDSEQPAEAITRALAQASSFLASIRFLRDDVERVRRIDRAQVSLLISRYLSDWVFVNQIRSGLQPDLRDPMKKTDEVEAAALEQIKPIGEDLFNDQFKRNVHAFLLSNGERAQYEVRLLQRLTFRLFMKADSPQTTEAGIKPAVYLVHLGNMAVPQLRPNKSWRILTDGLDERVERRWDTIDWPSFKTDAEAVVMSVKIASQPGLGSPEGFTILSKRVRDARRIEISAPTAQGAFYALGKLEQMGIDGRLAQDFQLNENPAAAQRGVIENFSDPQWSHRDRVEMIRFLGRVRMNRYYYVPEGGNERLSEQKLRELLRVADENFVQFVYGNRPDSSTSSSINSAKADDDIICLDPKPGDFSALDGNSISFIVSAKKQLQVSKQMLATASEYAWYGNNADHASAFNNALNLLYDERTRSGVRAWSQIRGDCGGSKKLTEQKLNELQAAIEVISVTRERGLLRGELAQFIARARAAIENRENANR